MLPRQSIAGALILVLSAAVLPSCSTAPKQKDQQTFLIRARSVNLWFENRVPGLTKQIEQSAGFVAFPDVAQWGILLGGGTFGRGVLCRPDGTQIGWAAINTGSIGLQAGVQGFRLLMVIQDEATLNKFKANQLAGSASGVLVGGDAGVSGTARFQNGVALYEGANSGLMAGVNIGLNYIRYEPLAPSEAPADYR